MKVIISGGRNVSLSEAGIAYLDEFFSVFSVELVLNGNASGIDNDVKRYCWDNKISIKLFPAKWNDLKAEGCVIKYNKYGNPYNANAGFARNEEMAREASPNGRLITFFGGPGTANMVEIARKYGITVEDLREQGELVVKL